MNNHVKWFAKLDIQL